MLPLELIFASVLCVLFIHVCGNQPREINPVGNCTRLKCEKVDENGVALLYMSGHAIENHTIVNRTAHSELNGEESECLRRCISIPSCITIVVGMTERKCWFYEGDDVYVFPETIVPKDGSKIISLGNGVCKFRPCVRGKCVPNFDGTGKFTCKCDPGFGGERCEERRAELYFSFDHDTSHPNPDMNDVEMRLEHAQLVRVNDWRSKVLLMKGGTYDAISIQNMANSKEQQYGNWISNPCNTKSNLTVTFWLKMVNTAAVQDDYRGVLEVTRWRIAYNRKSKMMQAFVATENDPRGLNPVNNVKCRVEQIDKWSQVALAMSGVAEEVKMYLDGQICDYKNVSGVEHDIWTKWDGPYLEIFKENEGISLMDELKFYNSYPLNDDVMQSNYAEEKKEHMS